LKVSETFESPFDEKTVWELISDPVRVVPCMPGASLGNVREDGSIEGALEASLGPVKVRFTGTVLPEYDHDAHRGTLVAKGSDAGGRTMATATTEFRLAAVAEDRTAVQVDATFNVSGGLAPFAQTGGVHLARTMLADFSANLASMAGGSGSGSEPGSPAAVAGSAGPAPGQHRIRGFRLGARVLWSMLRGLFTRDGSRRSARDGNPTSGIGEKS